MSEQILLYRSVFDAIPNTPITFRTLDIGSDKVLPYMAKVEEENPALGWRAIRLGLDRPGLLRSQLRAMLRAGAGRSLRIMFPMIATVEEFVAAKALAEKEIAHLARHKYEPPAELQIGVMVEVPSLLWQLEEICAKADFLSVGSNDLVQYMYAADRDNPRVSRRYDVLSAPILRALRSIARKASEAKKPLSLCGEMGGRPLEAVILAALGYKGLSMSPASIGPVKAAIMAMDFAKTQSYVVDLIERIDGGHSLRGELASFAQSHGIPI
jgi:phosphotransferase system enzyme I (PtsP)